MNVMIIGGGFSYNKMFEERGFGVVYSLEEADLVQFTGGADVSPVMYGELPHPSTGFSARRDKEEMAVYKEAQKWSIPCAGICRGAQFLNVMNGGKMWQHVNNHAISGTHVMITDDGRDVEVTSTHHQMMRAAEHGDVLCVAYESDIREHMKDGVLCRETGEYEDTEVVLYTKTQSLCFQPHPEYLDKDHECQEYYFELIKNHLGVEV